MLGLLSRVWFWDLAEDGHQQSPWHRNSTPPWILFENYKIPNYWNIIESTHCIMEKFNLGLDQKIWSGTWPLIQGDMVGKWFKMFFSVPVSTFQGCCEDSMRQCTWNSRGTRQIVALSLPSKRNQLTTAQCKGSLPVSSWQPVVGHLTGKAPWKHDTKNHKEIHPPPKQTAFEEEVESGFQRLCS